MAEFEMRFWQRGRKPPVLRQAEASECGLTCLAMASCHFGREVDTADLRQQFPSSTRGVSLASLIDIAARLDLHTRAVRAELDELGNLALPALLHWNMDHFVLLVEVRGERCVVHDPALGRVVCSREDVSRAFTGAALEVWPTDSFVKRRAARDARIDWRALSGRIEGYKAAMWQVFALAIGLQIGAMLMPVLTQLIVDRAIPQSDAALLAAIAAGFAVLTLVNTVVAGVRSWLVTYIRTELFFSWNKNIFAHLLKLPQSWFEQRHLGDMLSRFNAIGSIQQTVSTNLVEAALDGLLVLLTLALMLVYSPLLTAIPAVACVLYGLGRFVLYPAFLEANARQILDAAKHQGRLLEAIRAHQTIKVSNAQPLIASRFLAVLGDLVHAQIGVARQTIVAETVSRVVFGFARLGTFCLGAYLAVTHRLSAGAVLAFIVYASQFSDRVTSFVDYMVQLRLLNLQGGRLEDIVMAEPEPHRHSDFGGAPADATLSLRDASFRYSAQDPWLLRGCQLEVRPGEMIAIVGLSGAGKTTLMKLLMGLVDPVLGEVRLGGIDLTRLGKIAFRAQVGAVMQDNDFFGGTIAENICLFDPHPDTARIEECARLACVHEDILAMPMGYRTRIGGVGQMLSAGQRQRVALARAFYQRPRILILDEATCHVDIQTEAKILHAIEQMDVTRILVTHRRETYARADRVLFLEGGLLREKPAERGVAVLSRC